MVTWASRPLRRGRAGSGAEVCRPVTAPWHALPVPEAVLPRLLVRSRSGGCRRHGLRGSEARSTDSSKVEHGSGSGWARAVRRLGLSLAVAKPSCQRPSPASSSSVAPSAFASARSVRSEGSAMAPLSMRLMMVAETPEAWESAFWERPRDSKGDGTLQRGVSKP